MANEHDEARAEGGGQGGPARLTRSDLATLRRAARERWGVPDQLKTEAIFQAAKILTGSDAERMKLAAAKALVEFEKADLAAERLDLDRAKHEHATRPPEVIDDDYEIDLSDEEDPPLEGDGPAA